MRPVEWYFLVSFVGCVVLVPDSVLFGFSFIVICVLRN